MTDLPQGLAIVTDAEAALGRSMVLELVRKGIRVAGFGQGQLLAETARLAGGGFQPCKVDVSQADEVSAVMEQLAREQAPVSILINNAAVHSRLDFLDETPRSFMHSVAINLGGMVNCSHAALRLMVQTGHGRILNVSSFADLAPLPASSAYVVSCGAARIFTRALRADIEDRFPDIVINDWIPGLPATRLDSVEGMASVRSAALWGVELALWKEASLSGTIWERDMEVLPLRSLRRRIKDTMLLRTRKPRWLSGAQHT